MIDIEDRKLLLEYSRQSIINFIKHRKLTKFNIKSAKSIVKLQEHKGCFITLKKGKKEILGCMGVIQSDLALYKNIMNYSIKSAVDDPRFPAILLKDLHSIDIEISIVRDIYPLMSLDEISIGKHGVIVKKGEHIGILLPNVAIDWKLNNITFLEHACIKAGLAKNEYKSSDSEIFYFKAEVFSEKTNSLLESSSTDFDEVKAG